MKPAMPDPAMPDPAMPNPAMPDRPAGAPAILLDLSDLFHHIGRGPATGIMRVTLAWLDHCLTLNRPVMGYIHHYRGAFLLDRSGMAWFGRTFREAQGWGEPDLRARLRLDLLPDQRRALAAVRARAVAHAVPLAVRRMLRRHLPPGSAVLLTGFSNMHRAALAGFVGAGLAPVVLIHDTIPLDFPQYVPKGGADWFARRLAAVGELARVVLYNSDQTRRDAEAHLARRGRVPPGVVAHLGVSPVRPDSSALPEGFDPASAPYFVVLGTIEARKNHEFLLDLWDAMARRGDSPMPRLVIIGSRGWRIEALLQRLDTSPLRGKTVIELNGLGDGAVAAIMARARGLLFPSHAEGFGLPAIEAAALGVPVIANDLAVYREFLGDWPTLIPVTDPEGWRAAILALANGTAPRRPPPPPLPTWEAHFATLMAAVDGMVPSG